MIKKLLILILAILLSSCTVIKVKKLPDGGYEGSYWSSREIGKIKATVETPDGIKFSIKAESVTSPEVISEGLKLIEKYGALQ